MSTYLCYFLFVFLLFFLHFSAVTYTTAVVAEVPATSVPPPVVKAAALEVAPAAQTVGRPSWWKFLIQGRLSSLVMNSPTLTPLSMFLMMRAKDFYILTWLMQVRRLCFWFVFFILCSELFWTDFFFCVQLRSSNCKLFLSQGM